MIIEIALVIIILIIVFTEFIKYYFFKSIERFENPLIFNQPYDENKLFKYNIDKRTQLRYWC